MQNVRMGETRIYSSHLAGNTDHKCCTIRQPLGGNCVSRCENREMPKWYSAVILHGVKVHASFSTPSVASDASVSRLCRIIPTTFQKAAVRQYRELHQPLGTASRILMWLLGCSSHIMLQKRYMVDNHSYEEK